MQTRVPEKEIPVEMVSSLYEGRMSYIASMAGELSQMASAAGEAHIADIFATAAQAARDCVQKQGDN